MGIQNEVWLVTLVGMGVVTLGFLYVVSQAGRAGDASRVQRASGSIRRWWFLALVLLGIGVTWASLRPFPIADQHGTLQGAQVVDVLGRQWGWTLSQSDLEAGVPVEFRVTSADVNHGFAIYNPAGHIVAQTQAMPGYTNKLVHTFRQPGTYRVLCLEYCGLAHHGMVAEFRVRAADEGDPS